MNFMQRLLRLPHLILALTLVGALTGILAYKHLPINLFPDTNRPMVAVVTQWPGATAKDVAAEVTHPMEVRLSAIDGVRRVTSTSRDQVSAVTVEFEYGISINTAATQVNTELPRVSGLLPQGIKSPLIFKITDAARPAVVLAVTAGKDIALDLAQVRRTAENPLRDQLLAIPGVAEAEVFGGAVRQVAVDLDRNKLEQHGLSVAKVAGALAGSNLSVPAGLLHRDGYRLLMTTQNLAQGPDDLADVLVPVSGGSFVRVGDLGNIHWGEADPTSLYRGNGQQAIAVSLLRGDSGNASTVVAAIDKALPTIRKAFPMLDISVADTQGRLINLTVDNMLEALRDAVIMTIAVILIFLANTRAAFITALSLPFTYLLTFAAMRLFGYDFNMVTLTAVIIAVGMLADDAIVVIENIERRMTKLGESGVNVAANGTQEVMLAVLSGTVSNAIVLLPIMFIGGYVQTVLRPLAVTLTLALLASFIVSITIIPLLTPWLLKPGAADPLSRALRPFDRFVLTPLKNFYATLVGWGIQHRALVLLIFFGLFLISARQMPLVGRELMPLMDSGVMNVNFEAEADTDAPRMAAIANEIESRIRKDINPDWLLSTSTVVGAEPSVKSFGAARTLQQGQTTVNLIDRFHRDQSMFEIEEHLRQNLRKIPGLVSLNVTEFGATPLSSLRGTVDVMITGPDPAVLDKLADEVERRLDGVKGLTGTERSWQGGSRRINLDVDEAQAALYGLTPIAIAKQVAAQVGGAPGGRLRIPGENPVPVWVRLKADQRSNTEAVAALTIHAADGKALPLSAVARPVLTHAPTAETHQGLLPTVDVIGYRRNIAVTHLQDNVDAALKGLSLPRGYRLSQEGEIKQMGESFARLGVSLALGLGLLYLVLTISFRSFLHPLAILGTLPLAIIGAAWAMLIADKHGCMPSFMGLILLMGIVVKNGILLVDFAQVALAEGKSLHDAVLQAVELRTRPILMTAGAAAVGMVPIAMEWAVGIERLSPLAVVAIGGLIAGTFLTLLVVPVLFHLLESARMRLTGKAGN